TAKCSDATPGTRSSSSPSGSDPAQGPPLAHPSTPRRPPDVYGGAMACASTTGARPMAHKDPFTLDLFANTSLSSGLGLSVTGFPAAIEADEAEQARSLPIPSPPLPVVSVSSREARPKAENC